MSDFLSRAMNASNNNSINSMHTCFPALVIAYDEITHTATLQPLYKYESGETYPQIQQIPVIKWRYKIKQNKNITESGLAHSHSYSWSDGSGSGTTGQESSHIHSILFEEIIEEIKLLLYPGDLVICSCSEKSIDSISSKQVHDPQSKRKFDISDAIVIGIL